MRSPQQVLTIALALSPLAAAWSKWLPDVDSLVVRQNDDSTSTQDKPTQTASPKSSATDDAPEQTSTAQSTKTSSDDGSSSSSDSNASTTTGTGKSTKTGTSKTTKTGNSKHTTYNALDPAGSVALLEPATTSAMPLYRIDNTEPVTWKWNYTSLQGKPTAIDVMISCSKASATWTLTQNMTFAPTATFTWDTDKYQSAQIGSQLPVEQYTLLIKDSDSAFTDTPDPGYLAPYAGFQFGLYTAKPYTDLNEWKCATCSAAPGGHLDRQALQFAVSMTLLTVLSFTWYVTGMAALV